MMEQNTTASKIMLIDDDEDDYLIVKSIISKIPNAEFLLTWCHSYDDAKTIVQQNDYDLFLIDYRLGAHNGLELLMIAEPQKRAEPFIMLTGAGDNVIEQQAMQLGAADYLVKGSFDAELLSRTLRYALQRKFLEQQRIEQLMEVNRTKDEFISLASHQLRTPATGVKQYVGMVLEGYAGDVSEAQRDMLEKAYESNERQLKIVTDLLRVTRVDAGKVRLTRDKVDLVALIEDVLKEQNMKFYQRKQDVTFEKNADQILVNIDQDNFRMAFENLIDNASKYSEEGKTITVSIQKLGKTVTISVADQGVGIDPADFDKLFQKFSRIDNPLSTLVGGTGLGLYWSQKIVDLHGGKIEVSSERGRGTTFTVTLPE
ncbi:hypothetical protein CYG49_02565 [Candidatus Saccharibacteria bacterium]|nr:MAG: hypothetical protein CYG49_02565 [Candidatus Saccharibacteria bacterium]